ncbi:glycosyltransferase [Microbacterium sp. J1-1]|uniref:glycosyltransferase n=1 Tax=Microbacterium sp. J1-1 TaxID=2992441 RepID=UPI0021150D45|nr:glycosyltransferase [Microbacterium sp. J1-1]UUE21476.1 glycosyltransferase [Microbacterium sp. J1-1]
MIIEAIRGLNMGGAETLLFTRLRHAVEHRPPGFERTIVVNTLRHNDHFASQLRGLGVEVVELPSTHPVRGMKQLSSVIAAQDSVSTVVFHSPVTTYLEKTRRALRRSGSRVRLIDVVHSTRYRAPYQLMGAVLDRFSDLAIAVGTDVAEAPTARHYRAVSTVLAGVDRERMRSWTRASPEAPSQMRGQLGVPDGNRLVVAVGSLIPLKGHRHVIEALRSPDLAEVSLALVGEGAERSSLQELAEGIGVSSRVHFVGRVDDAWRWTAIADALVHPSYFEGLPVAVIEAAALGTPIVATDVGGLRQIVDRPSMGRLVEAPDARLLSAALSEVLVTARPAAQVFAGRATGESFWSMDRYATDFYCALESAAE